MSTDHITVTSAISGVRFNVRILNEGDAYGLSGALAWEHEDRPGVEFYDSRYPHTPLGQFVSRYFVDDIIDGTTGLDLMGYEPSWKIDAAAMSIVRSWLVQETSRSYVVGVPLVVTVSRSGHVTFEVDLSEVGDIDEDEDAAERYSDAVIAADILTAEGAARRLQHTFTRTVNPTA